MLMKRATRELHILGFDDYEIHRAGYGYVVRHKTAYRQTGNVYISAIGAIDSVKRGIFPKILEMTK